MVLDNITALLPSPLTATPGDLSSVLCALGALRRGTGANLALWVVSGADPQAGLLPHLPPVLPVRFPAYSEEQVVDLLAEVRGRRSLKEGAGVGMAGGQAHTHETDGIQHKPAMIPLI